MIEVKFNEEMLRKIVREEIDGYFSEIDGRSLNQEVWWSMADLERYTGFKKNWLKDNILYKPIFKKELDILNGGFVHYPSSQGETWTFQAHKMRGFLEKRFNKIFTLKQGK